MARTLPSAVSAAVASPNTQPIYLVEMGWSATTYSATWNAAITWNGETWAASGIAVSRVSSSRATIELPNGDADAWAALVLGETPRGRTINIYEYHTDKTVSPHAADAVQIFGGVMDEADIADVISVECIPAPRVRQFPHTSIDPSTYNYLLTPGQVIRSGGQTVTVE